jgi:hypothetical protein
MEDSSASRDPYAAPPSSISAPANRRGSQVLRFLVTSSVFGLTYPFSVPLVANLPHGIIALLVVGLVSLPTIWILLPQLKTHGLRGISAIKFISVSLGFLATSFGILVAALSVLFLLWPLLGLPPLPSD